MRGLFDIAWELRWLPAHTGKGPQLQHETPKR